MKFLIAMISICSIASANKMINGAGATFPFPLYSKWFSEYHKAHGVQVNYNSIGSGSGITKFIEQTIDFGASDSPMTDEQMAKVKEGAIHIPTALGAVVLTYNLEGVNQPLKLTGELVADIFLGKITKWNDPRLLAVNKNLPSLPVIPVYRSDGSGTTAIFTDYLSKVSPAWKAEVGQGTAVKWKGGLGGRGNEGVTAQVKQTKGAVGYVEYIYAESNRLPIAEVQNRAGQYIHPTVKSVTAAAQGALKNMPKDYRVSITDPDGKASYPISGFTYILVRGTLPKESGPKVISLLNWVVGPGQLMTEALKYAPLPKGLQAKVKKTIQGIKVE